MDLVNKRIVVTGAASGIGLSLLNLLAGFPLKILAVDVNGGLLESVCRELHHTNKLRGITPVATITPYQCDLSTQENVDKLFDEAFRILGGIDIFIANAGFAYYEQITEPDWVHIDKIYRVNVLSNIYIIEKMQELHIHEPYKVVVTASAMAHIAVPGYAIYSSTKSALDRFADGYRWQMKDPRQLLLVYPIATRTKFFQAAGAGVPTPWPSQTAEAVARSILRGIRHDRKRVYPSFVFQIILFIKRFLPAHWLVQKLEQKRMDRWLARQDD